MTLYRLLSVTGLPGSIHLDYHSSSHVFFICPLCVCRRNQELALPSGGPMPTYADIAIFAMVSFLVSDVIPGERDWHMNNIMFGGPGC